MHPGVLIAVLWDLINLMFTLCRSFLLQRIHGLLFVHFLRFVFVVGPESCVQLVVVRVIVVEVAVLAERV